jgi:hypothetical protein
MSESQEPPVETVEIRPEDRRVELDEQPLALAEAETAGTLPEADRRVHDNDPVPTEAPAETLEMPVGEISHIRERPDGTRVDAAGHILG